jgi:hypothetical protein
MSNASLKEQLQAVASKISASTSTPVSDQKPTVSHSSKPKTPQTPQTIKPKKQKPKWLEYVQ